MGLTKANSNQVKPTRGRSRSTSPDSTSIDLRDLRMPADSNKLDLRYPRVPWERRREIGKALRQRTPRESHGNKASATQKRPDPLALLELSNRGRQEQLIPLRMGRMAASPFAFLRGSACVMAWDLSKTMSSGINVIIDGDAHLNNFGMYGTPQRDVIFDLNDFDEATIGPWEWDLKRLVASVNVAGRQNGLGPGERAEAVLQCVAGYRWNIQRLQGMGVLDVWYLHAYPGRENTLIKMDSKSDAIFRKTAAKAITQTNATLLAKLAQREVNGGWRFRESPPILTRVKDSTRDQIIGGLNLYSRSLPPERAYMLSQYHVVDIAHRIVGIGSVGTRAYLALLFGNCDSDPLFLQVKEAAPPAHGPYLPPLPKAYADHGRREVMGQTSLQASSDVMLGHTVIDGRPYLVRQMKNMKASIETTDLTGKSFGFYAWACAALLARGHSRSGDAAAIAGYCGGNAVLDEALVTWAEDYGDQTERDHQRLVSAIKTGRVAAITEV
jgi:uncharacterized protein (DUF2252 family)